MLISQAKRLLLYPPPLQKNQTFSFRTNNGTKLKIELKIKSYQTTSYTTNSDSASPIMIGRCKNNTNKNRKLEVSAGHRPDGEET